MKAKGIVESENFFLRILHCLKILFNYTILDRLSQKTISRYCPFKDSVGIVKKDSRTNFSQTSVAQV
jgi:hypothetical protein